MAMLLTRAVRRLLPAWGLAAARPLGPLPCRRMSSKVHGIFFNYVDHLRPHLFARPTSSTNSSRPIVDAMLDFLPDDEANQLRWCWSVLDHSNGLLLCEMGTRELCVCNPATRRWTLLPYASPQEGDCMYLAFDPAESPHYQVVVIPGVPNDERRCSMESEWPPTPWKLNVFSSRTDEWEERSFIRYGEPAGTVQDMLVDEVEASYWGPNQRYAVYCQGALYVHCRGCFVSRLSLSSNTYQVIKTPSYSVKKGCVKPYLGRSQNAVYFGIVSRESEQLLIWILSESGGQMEWIVRYQNDLAPLAQHLIKYDRLMNAPWIIHDVFDTKVDAYAKSLPKEISEWNSDSDDIFTIKCGATNHYKKFHILGFHPYKEVVYLADSFGVVAYHLTNSKVQFLGYARPESYSLNHTNHIYESFVYTPCMVDELNYEEILTGTRLEN